MAETKTYAGGCHCGKVRFEVKTDLGRVVACNCSICSKKGWLLTFVPPEQFTLLSEGDLLSDYQFGKKRVHHLFCPTWIQSFGRGVTPDGRDIRAINVRCLEDVDVDVDGKSL